MPRKHRTRATNTRASHRDTVYELSEALLENGRAFETPIKRKNWSLHDLKTIKPLTPTQNDMFRDFIEGQHICAHGVAGTGKTYLSIFLALNELLDPRSEIERIIIIRSAVQTRELGHLPGDIFEKLALYELPYKDIFADLLKRKSSYQDMKDAGIVEFCSTSFVRGLTWDNTIVILDEAQNMAWAELDSVVTRLGQNSRLIVCGDSTHQCDLRREQSGFNDAVRLMSRLDHFSTINFTKYDIVRSEFAKSWIIARDELSL